jgi:hypothetical protein
MAQTVHRHHLLIFDSVTELRVLLFAQLERFALGSYTNSQGHGGGLLSRTMSDSKLAVGSAAGLAEAMAQAQYSPGRSNVVADLSASVMIHKRSPAAVV